MQDIERFLQQNQIFDFSTLARVAIRRFIENPSLEIRGVLASKRERPNQRNGERSL